MTLSIIKQNATVDLCRRQLQMTVEVNRILNAAYFKVYFIFGVLLFTFILTGWKNKQSETVLLHFHL